MRLFVSRTVSRSHACGTAVVPHASVTTAQGPRRRESVARAAAALGLWTALLCGAASAIPIQWQTSAGGNGNYYERVDQTGLTFGAARTAAAARSYLGVPGRLVIFETPTYAAEFNFVSTNVYAPGVQSSRGYWAGANSPNGVNPWTWIDGTVVPTSITSTWNIDNFEGPGPEGIGFYQPGTTLWDYIETNSSGLISGYVVEYQPAGPVGVPEVDPAGLASVAGLVAGAFGLRERQRRW